MTDDDNKPITILSKRERWGIKRGSIKVLPSGAVEMWIQGYGGGSNRSNNSGPTGKKASRFYPARALRKKLGKHGLKRFNPLFKAH